MDNRITEQLNAIKSEDLIWFVSFFLVLLSVISNLYEKNAILENNPDLNKISIDIKIVIFIILLFVNLYFVSVILESLKFEQNNAQETSLNQARLVAALLFLIGGIIYLIVEIQTKIETN